jgi:hypothetical protein
MGSETGPEPDWADQLRAGFAGFAEALAHVGHIARAQGAMGWLYRGDLDQAARALDGLPPDVLRQVSTAAQALSTLADERLAAEPSD